MTYLHSSISSSDGRRYVRVLAIVLGTLIVMLLAITSIGYGLGLIDSANQQIYDYQRDKVDGLSRIDAAFVGDSSLGNAIDARLFGELSGLATANLALNGSYGAGGAYNMSRDVIAAARPRLLVIMLSLDTMRRSNAFPGFYFSASLVQRLRQSPLRILALYFNWKAARRTIEELASGQWQPGAVAIANDYIEQNLDGMRRSPATELAANPLLPDMIAPAQIEYLGRIAVVCRTHAITCVYAHGPIYRDYCLRYAAYVSVLNAAIRAAGLDVVPDTPLCMNADELGDSIDHVRPGLKQQFTERYFERLNVAVAQPHKVAWD